VWALTLLLEFPDNIVLFANARESLRIHDFLTGPRFKASAKPLHASQRPWRGCVHRTWQEYVAVPVLYKVLGFRSGNYEECRLLGCYAVWLL
jgi:hypothetical protein